MDYLLGCPLTLKKKSIAWFSLRHPQMAKDRYNTHEPVDKPNLQNTSHLDAEDGEVIV